jgi:hypothetical protein
MNPFKDQGILSQVFLMKAAKRPHKVAPVGPQSFNGIGMDLIDAVSVVVSSPLSLTVPDGVVVAVGVSQGLIGMSFIGINRSVWLSGCLDQRYDRFLFSIGADFQPDLVGLTSNQPNNGRTVCFHRASPTSLVGSRPGWVLVVIVISRALMTTILVHFVNFNRFIRQLDSQTVAQPLGLETMTPLEQVAVVSSQLLGNVTCRVALDDASQQQDDFGTGEADIAQHRVGEEIKHPPTGPTAIAHNWVSGAVVWRLLRRQGVACRTAQARWVQDLFQKIVTLLLVHQLIDGKWEHCFSPPASHFNTSLFDSP